MTDHDPGGIGLERRIALLENENRWFRFAGAAVLLFASGVVILGQANSRPATIEAREIVLRDDGGRTRVRLAVTPEGPVLGTVDGPEQPRAGLGASAGSAGDLTFFDGTGRAGVGLGAGVGTDPGILLPGVDGNPLLARP